MEKADVFVLPSRVEPFGIVVLEALRAGTPVVVSDRGGAGEIVDAGQGLLVDPTDTSALAASISRLLGDPSLRERLAYSGRLRAKAFGWEGITLQYESVYESVVQARRPRRRLLRTGVTR